MRLLDLHLRAKGVLKSAGIEDYAFEAGLLLEHFFGIKPYRLAVNAEICADEEIVPLFEKALEKRAGGYPLQYILGRWEFYGLPFYVGDGVLIPRPDTETLVDAARELSGENPVIIDLCSGSGCIAVALEKNIKGAKVFAVEFSKAAFSYLERNIELNSSKVVPVLGDVLDEELLDGFEAADMIVSNPPYLSDEDMQNLQREVGFEPETALFGGGDGMDFYRRISALWKKKLKSGGHMLFEVGIGQAGQVCNILKSEGFSEIEAKKDLNGIARVVFGKYL